MSTELWQEEADQFFNHYNYDNWYDSNDQYYHIEPKRARRIRQRLRMIARGRNHELQRNAYWWNGKDRHRRERAEMFGRYHHNHLALCSCNVCGNPRHNDWGSDKYRLTLQERRAKLAEIEQVKELRYDQDGF